MADSSLLQNVYLFKGLSGDQLRATNELGHVETLNAGDDVFSQGEKATALYIIKYGSIRIHQRSSNGDNIEVATLGTGSHFGEMAMVDGEDRSATATALEKSEVIVLPYDKLQDLLGRESAIAIHFYRELAHFLCGRLRVTTNDLSYAREKNLSHF